MQFVDTEWITEKTITFNEKQSRRQISFFSVNWFKPFENRQQSICSSVCSITTFNFRRPRIPVGVSQTRWFCRWDDAIKPWIVGLLVLILVAYSHMLRITAKTALSSCRPFTFRYTNVSFGKECRRRILLKYLNKGPTSPLRSLDLFRGFFNSSIFSKPV